MSDTIEAKSTEAMYDRWHEALERTPMKGEDPRRAVLISEILGPVDGPYGMNGELQTD